MGEERGSMTSAQTGIGRRSRIPAAALASAALTVLGVGSILTSAQTTPTADACPNGTPASGAASTEPCVVIGEFDIYFKPNLVTIPADTAVKVFLPNDGVTEHDFSVTDHGNSGLKDLDISVKTQPGDTSETTINAPEGDYYFFCSIPGHEAAGMRGYITVKADATITTSEATVTPRAG
jgi:nitrite reductase (NO-forming)